MPEALLPVPGVENKEPGVRFVVPRLRPAPPEGGLAAELLAASGNGFSGNGNGYHGVENWLEPAVRPERPGKPRRKRQLSNGGAFPPVDSVYGAGKACAARVGQIFHLDFGCEDCGGRWWWCTWELRFYGYCLSCWYCGSDLYFQPDGKRYVPERIVDGAPGRPVGSRKVVGDLIPLE